MIRVVVAEDHALVRGSFRLLVDSAPDLTVVAEAADGAEAVTAVQRHQLDVVLKDIQPDELLRAVRVVAGGEALLAPTVTRRLLASFAARTPRRELTGITEREREVLVLVARALSNQDIADEPGVSLHTAKTHVGRLLTKLGARDRTQLVVLAYESGLVRAGEI